MRKKECDARQFWGLRFIPALRGGTNLVGSVPRAVTLYPRNEDPFVGAPPWAIFVLSLRETARGRD
jgi:hypothetical protein